MIVTYDFNFDIDFDYDDSFDKDKESVERENLVRTDVV